MYVVLEKYLVCKEINYIYVDFRRKLFRCLIRFKIWKINGIFENLHEDEDD